MLKNIFPNVFVWDAPYQWLMVIDDGGLIEPEM